MLNTFTCGITTAVVVSLLLGSSVQKIFCTFIVLAQLDSIHKVSKHAIFFRENFHKMSKQANILRENNASISAVFQAKIYQLKQELLQKDVLFAKHRDDMHNLRLINAAQHRNLWSELHNFRFVDEKNGRKLYEEFLEDDPEFGPAMPKSHAFALALVNDCVMVSRRTSRALDEFKKGAKLEKSMMEQSFGETSAIQLTEIKTLKSKNAKFVEEIKKLEIQCETFKSDQEKLKQEHKTVKADFEAFKLKYKTLKKKVETVKKKHEASGKNLETLKKEQEILKNKADTPKEEQKTLKKTLGTPNKEQETLKKKVETPKKEQENLKKNPQTSQQEQETLKSTLETPKEQETLKKRVETPKKEQETLKKRVETPKEEEETLRKSLEIMKKEQETLKKERDSLRSELKQAKDSKYEDIIKCAKEDRDSELDAIFMLINAKSDNKLLPCFQTVYDNAVMRGLITPSPAIVDDDEIE